MLIHSRELQKTSPGARKSLIDSKLTLLLSSVNPKRNRLSQFDPRQILRSAHRTIISEHFFDVALKKMGRCQASCAVNAGTHRSIPSSPKPMLSESRTPYAPINPSFVPEPLAVFPSSYNSVGAPTDLPVPHHHFPYSSSLLVQFPRPLHWFPQISHLGTATSCSYSKESKGRN